MIHTLILHLTTVSRALVGAINGRRRNDQSRHPDPERDLGVSTLEMVILVLGLMGIAAVLVAALTQAVTSRTAQIK